MADSFHEGARCETVIQVETRQAAACGPQDLGRAAALVFAGPENLGTLSGPMKDLLDRCYYPLLDRMQGRRYAHLVCAGSDGEGAARQLARILGGWRMVPMAPPLIVRTGAQTPEAIEAPKVIGAADRVRCFELGHALASGLALGVY